MFRILLAGEVQLGSSTLAEFAPGAATRDLRRDRANGYHRPPRAIPPGSLSPAREP
jgi:hypothetical protein